MTGLQNGHIASAQVYAFGCLPRLRQLQIETVIDVDTVGDEEHAVVELAGLPAGLQSLEVGYGAVVLLREGSRACMRGRCQESDRPEFRHGPATTERI